MTLYLSNRDGDGKTSESGHFRFPTNTFDGDILQSSSMLVTQNSPLGMSVLVSAGDFKINSGTGFSYAGWNSANKVVTITTADAANPRITTIVAYVDKGATTSPSPPNNPDIIKIEAVNGTPSGVPAAPNDSTIQTEIGAGNPYIILADVRVNAGATSISNSAITDRRTMITLSSDLYTSDTSMTGYHTRKVPSQQAVKTYVDYSYIADLEMTDFNNAAFLVPRKWEISATAVMNTIGNRPPNAVAGFGETRALATTGVIVGQPWGYALQTWTNYTGERWARTVQTNGSGTVSYGTWYQFAARYDTDWITPTMANGWVSYNNGATYAIPGYMKDSLGFVHIKGLVKNGTAGLCFTLPVGYRPLNRKIFSTFGSAGAARVDVIDNGQVVFGTNYSTSWTSIEPIYFRAEQ